MNSSLKNILFVGLAIIHFQSFGADSSTQTQFHARTSQPDFNGDGQADLVFRRTEPHLIAVLDKDGQTQFNSGFATLDSDMPVIGDFDGDGLTDLAIRQIGSATWKVKNSSGSNFNSVAENGEQQVVFARLREDIPAIGDYDGDGISDFAVFRPSSQMWYVRNSSLNNFNSTLEDGIQRIQLGDLPSFIPVPGDYDGDGITDMAVFDAQNSDWLIRYSSSGTSQNFSFGISEADIPVVADYDGDGKTDIAVWNSKLMIWEIEQSASGRVRSEVFGYYTSDIPIVADYDGDGLADLALRSLTDRSVHILSSRSQLVRSIRVGHFDDVPINAPSYLVMRMIQDGNNRLDTDGDGISDHDEIELHGTNPHLSDSDGDGLSDFDEVNSYKTDPNNADTDGDGLSDANEIRVHGTSPTDSDTDNDGVNDGQEVADGTAPGIHLPFPEQRLLSEYVYVGYGESLRDGYTVTGAHLEFDSLSEYRFPVYKFANDNTGWAGNERNAFVWNINHQDELVLTQFSDSTRFVNEGFTDPIVELDHDRLDWVFYPENFLLGKEPVIYNRLKNVDFQNSTARWSYEKNIKEIRVIPQQWDGNILNVTFTPVVEHILTIPSEYRQYFDGQSKIVGIDIDTRDEVRSLIFSSQTPDLPFDADEMQGNWIIPHIYPPPGTTYIRNQSVVSNQPERNYIDRFTFTSGFATGQFSGYQYSWSISQNTLVMERGSDKYKFTPFSKTGNQYQVLAHHYRDEQLQRTYVARLVKADESGTTFLNNLQVELPHAYIEQHWHKNSLQDNGVPYFGTAHKFNGDGTVQYGLRELYGFGSNRDYRFISLFNAKYSVDHNANRINFNYVDEPNRSWEILHVDDAGKVTYLEVHREAYDLDGDGFIQDNELNQPSIIEIKELTVEDLSRYWYSYPNSNLEHATSQLNATQEVSLSVNLPANASSLPLSGFNPIDPNTYNESTSITLYDSLGLPELQTFYFIKDNNPTPGQSNEWVVVTSIDGNFVNYTGGANVAQGSGTSLGPGTHGKNGVPGSNLVGYNQTLVINNAYNPVTSIATGVWGIRLRFNSAGELVDIFHPSSDMNNTQAGANSVLNSTSMPLPELEFYNVPRMRGANAHNALRTNFNISIVTPSDSATTTQLASPFVVHHAQHDGFFEQNEWEFDLRAWQLNNNNGFVKATTEVDIKVNLSASSVHLDRNNFNPNDFNSFNSSWSTGFVDSLGNTHRLQFYFIKDSNANSGQPNEWLVVASIDGNFINFTNGQGASQGQGAVLPNGDLSHSNAQGSNLVGFNQSLPVLGGTTNTGIWGVRLRFDTTGDLVDIFSPAYWMVDHSVRLPGNMPIPETEPLGALVGGEADGSQRIRLNFNLDLTDQSSVNEPTQYGSRTWFTYVFQDGRTTGSQ